MHVVRAGPWPVTVCWTSSQPLSAHCKLVRTHESECVCVCVCVCACVHGKLFPGNVFVAIPDVYANFLVLLL